MLNNVLSFHLLIGAGGALGGPPAGAGGLLPGGNGGPGGPGLLLPGGAGGLPPGAGGAFDSEKEKGKRVKKTERLNNVL